MPCLCEAKMKCNHHVMRLFPFCELWQLLALSYRGSDCRSVVGKPLLVCRTGSGKVGRSSRQGVAVEDPYRCEQHSLVGSRKLHRRVVGCKWHPEDLEPEKKRCLKVRSPCIFN